MTQKEIGPKLIQMPLGWVPPTASKVIDFTQVDVYPLKYKYIDGRVIINSIVIEDINRQQDVLKKLNTTVLVGDVIQIDIKFGHFENGQWVDLYKKGKFKVKKILPRPLFSEILLLVFEVNS